MLVKHELKYVNQRRRSVPQARHETGSAVSVRRPALAATAGSRPVFVSSMVTTSEGRMASAAGGLTVVRDDAAADAVRVSGETPGNDEALAVAGTGAAGLAWGESAS